jgi:hypothetical protein
VSDPRGRAPVPVPLNATAAELLARLCVELGTDDPASVLGRALSLLDMALSVKRTGRRLVMLDPETGRTSDVVL